MEKREKEFDEIVDVLRPKYTEDGWLDSELVNETIKAFKQVKLILTDVSSMFSAEQMEQAFNDGAKAEKDRCGEFEIENYC